MKVFRSFINIVLLMSILTSCAAISAKKIKPEDYPKVSENEIKGIKLLYDYNSGDRKYYQHFNDKVGEIFSSEEYNIKYSGKNYKNCEIKFSSDSYYPLEKFCNAYGILSGFTLFIIPAYCQKNFELKASLVTRIDESQLTNQSMIIKPNEEEAKEGEYFIDENNNLTKLLKRYYLKDKVHEVWSLIWGITWPIINPSKYIDGIDFPEEAKEDTKERISEALARQVIHDANQFEECKKR
jgi:hypothetical protein